MNFRYVLLGPRAFLWNLAAIGAGLNLSRSTPMMAKR
jgi:hypothetical protein